MHRGKRCSKSGMRDEVRGIVVTRHFTRVQNTSAVIKSISFFNRVEKVRACEEESKETEGMKSRRTDSAY